jgi:hypothetical protein
MKPAITEVKLYTGGKSGVEGKKSLFCLHCSGEAYGRAKDPGWIDTPRTPISPNKLKVMGKTPGADGKVWVTLDDDTEPMITVTAKGVKDYNAGPQTTEEVDKYKLSIIAKEMALEPKEVVSGAAFCVGQNVLFRLADLPDGVTADNFEWTLAGTYVNKRIPPVNSDASEIYTNEPALLKNPVITNCWWVSGGYQPPEEYLATVKCVLHFANGNPDEKISTEGKFNMYRPKAKITTQTSQVSVHSREPGTQKLSFCEPQSGGREGITFLHTM